MIKGGVSRVGKPLHYTSLVIDDPEFKKKIKKSVLKKMTNPKKDIKWCSLLILKFYVIYHVNI